MSPRPEYLRLCHMLDCSLRHFSDLTVDSLTHEIEELLIALTQVFRRVKQWTLELESRPKFVPDEKLLVGSSDIGECEDSETSCLDNSHCLANLIGHLVFLLAINNPYAQHLVGNTLLAISDFVITSGSNWDTFIRLLCIYLELTVWSTLSSSPEPSTVTKKYSYDGFSVPKSLLKLRAESANWNAVAAIIRVLRNILKYLKQDHDDAIMKTYLDSVSSLFLDVPWDLLCEINFDINAKARRGSDKYVPIHSKVVLPEEISMFCGNLLQFLCSLVDQRSYMKDGVGSFADIFLMSNLVPKLIDCCHVHLRSPELDSSFQYSRHKILMLMIKLSSQRYVENAVLMSLIHLVHKYFEDLLLQPISGCKTDENVSLEGSPFCINEGKQSGMSCHLQRLAVFLFLRFSLNLAGFKEHTDEQCARENMMSCLTSGVNLHAVHCTKCKGLSELQKWLQAQFPADTAMINEFYVHHCARFTLSFLQLFMHEDDLLFEMLLQLLCVPFYPKHQTFESEARFAVENHQIFLLSDLFNPVHLFHLFLSQILYDHQVLLDYLISKDTGSSSAEYLLRALRLVCNSWNIFLEFPGVKEDFNQSRSKRQKVLADNLDFNRVRSPAHVKYGHRLPFAASRDCLISLRASIENLNQKNLFPYNPQALLRRLMRFEELCAQH